MRHLGALFICLIFIFSTVMAYAAPVGNIATPKMLNSGLIIKDKESPVTIVLVPEIDLTNDRNIKDQKGDTEYKFYGGKAGMVVARRAFLYGLFGVAEAEQEFKVSGSNVEWDTDRDLVWGAGVTVILYEKEVMVREKGILRLGIDGRYRRSELDVDEVRLNGTKYTMPNSNVTGLNFESDELQVALGLSYHFGRLVPYAGVKYSDIDGKAKATISGTKYEQTFEPKHNVGIFVGGDILITDSVSAYAEGRFIDETAFTAGTAIRF